MASDLGCLFGGYLAPFLHKRLGMALIPSRLTVITIGALCMIGPALVSFVVNPIVAILCFSLGGFAHQMLSSMMYAVVGDVFEKPEIGDRHRHRRHVRLSRRRDLHARARPARQHRRLRAAVRHAVPVRRLIAAAVLWIFIGRSPGPIPAAVPAE